MKIGFTGSQGTGKTTLAKVVAATLNYDFQPSISHEAAQAGFLMNREADRMSQLITLVARINAENGWKYKSSKSLVLDRTVIDSLAYTMYQNTNVWEDNNHYFFEQCCHLVFDHAKTYDHLFYFPVYWNPSHREDGLRDNDALYQSLIDFNVKSLLDHMGNSYHIVPKGTTAERLAFVLDRI